jgi:DNA repair exonuclease SbcCD ATPase subunit
VIETRKYHEWLIARKAEKARLEQRFGVVSRSLEEAAVKESRCKEAREVVNAVQLLTQESVKDFIEELVSLALSSVYGDEYAFVVEYEVKRNKSEASCYVVKGGERMDPKDEVGGGVLDVASFGLRLVLWAMSSPRSAPVMIFDEPFKYVSRDRIDKAAEMVREISTMLGIQMVMVTHDTVLAELADRAWRVHQENGVSIVSPFAEGMLNGQE